MYTFMKGFFGILSGGTLKCSVQDLQHILKLNVLKTHVSKSCLSIPNQTVIHNKISKKNKKKTTTCPVLLITYGQVKLQ